MVSNAGCVRITQSHATRRICDWPQALVTHAASDPPKGLLLDPTFRDGGHLLHLLRMDGSTSAHAEIAVLKARTAALTHRPSKMWEDRVASSRLARNPTERGPLTA
jgi:Haem-degrading